MGVKIHSRLVKFSRTILISQQFYNPGTFLSHPDKNHSRPLLTFTCRNQKYLPPLAARLAVPCSSVCPLLCM